MGIETVEVGELLQGKQGRRQPYRILALPIVHVGGKGRQARTTDGGFVRERKGILENTGFTETRKGGGNFSVGMSTDLHVTETGSTLRTRKHRWVSGISCPQQKQLQSVLNPQVIRK